MNLLNKPHQNMRGSKEENKNEHHRRRQGKKWPDCPTWQQHKDHCSWNHESLVSSLESQAL